MAAPHYFVSHADFYITVDVAQTYKDPTTNTSQIFYSVTIDYRKHDTYYQRGWELRIGDEVVSEQSYETYDSYHGVLEYDRGYITISHNSDGTLSLPVYFTSKINGQTYEYTDTWELDSVIRPAIISTASNFTDDENPTIIYDNPSGEYITTLQAGITSVDGNTIFAAYRDIPKDGYSYTFELTDAELAALQSAAVNSKSVSVRFCIKSTTTEGQDYTSYADKTCTIVNAEPKVLVTLKDINPTTLDITGDSSVIVRYYSNVQYEMNVTTYKCATVKKVEAENGATKLTTASGVFNNVESDTFKFTATDSRGYWRTATVVPYKFVPYVRLTCNFAYNNPTTDGELTFRVTGNYYNGSFGAIPNSLGLQYRYKVEGEEEYGAWTYCARVIEGNTYTAEITLTGLDYQKGYTFQARAMDLMNPDYVYSATTYVQSKPVFHWGKEDFVFEVPVTFKAGANGIGDNAGEIEGSLNVAGDIRLKDSIMNYGNTIYFGDKEYCYLRELPDDTLRTHARHLVVETNDITINDAEDINIDASTISLTANTIRLNGEIATFSGVWTPTLDENAISEYYAQQGWYTKTGKVVTIGFYIQAECNSGYSSTAITIKNMMNEILLKTIINLRYFI